MTSYQYEIPRASTLFGGNKAVSWILDNWRISGISTFGTGGRGNIDTVSYSPAFEFLGGGENCGQYKVVGDPQLSGGDRNIDRWFDTAAFAPLSGRGDYNTNCEPWKFAMPGWHNHDLTFFKDVQTEGEPAAAVPLGDLQSVRPGAVPGREQEPNVQPDDGGADQHQLRQGDDGPHGAAHADVDSVHLLARGKHCIFNRRAGWTSNQPKREAQAQGARTLLRSPWARPRARKGVRTYDVFSSAAGRLCAGCSLIELGVDSHIRVSSSDYSKEVTVALYRRCKRAGRPSG